MNKSIDESTTPRMIKDDILPINAHRKYVEFIPGRLHEHYNFDT